ncbi:MAG: DctP family TRAP transporter solute-binding subunit [Rhodocyclales bacterium]|nr:DctP family TRAP transporter solute-binding subunit [Rhodocyclales bacterium]
MSNWLKPLLLATVLVAFSAQAQQPIVIKFPHVVSEKSPKGQAALVFKKRAEEILKDRVRVEVYPNSQLMGDDESLEALALGDIQMIAISLSKFDRLTKKFQLFDLPFLFKDMAAVDRFQASPAGKALLTEMEPKGYLGLAYWHNGLKQMTANKPLIKPEDAAGLKFRIQESDVLETQFRTLKANPQKMALGEVYQALMNGVIDAQENTWSNIYRLKFYEAQKHISETNHGVIDYLLTVNARWWKGLPADIRAGLEQAVREATAQNDANSEKSNLADRELVVKSGKTTIAKLTPEQLAAWQKAMQPVWVRYEKEIGPDLIKAAQSANK